MSLEVDWDRLFEAARSVQKNAHAPYSNFRVGAAVLTLDGRVSSACNVENASYGLSTCAEQNAIARAIADGARRVTAVAVMAEAEKPTPPCGRCRQILAEFADPQTPIRSRAPDGT